MSTFSTTSGSYEFGSGGNAANHPLFDPAKGFGFEPDDPSAFSVVAPEGNYRVTLTMSPRKQGSRVNVYAEQRRLMLEHVSFATTRETARSFVVNVRSPRLAAVPPNAPGSPEVRLKAREVGSRSWDDKLTIAVSARGEDLKRIAVEPVNVPTLYLAGDSTVADQAQTPDASWGQMLTRFFTPDIAVANHAESGETLKSFLAELRLDKLLENLRAGDWVMIQFGHNDQKSVWPQTYADAATTYRDYLRAYIAEVRRRGATPILVTSPERRNFDDAGHIVASLGDYPRAVREVGAETSVAVLDLNAASIQLYETMGPAESAKLFANDGRDRTHHDEMGAYALARRVIEALRAADPRLTAGLAGHIASDVPPAGILDEVNR